MPEHFVTDGVFQKAVIFNGGKVLLLKQSTRGGKIKGDQWDLPGGKLHKNENLEAALKREVREETGLDIEKPVLAAASIEKFRPDGKQRLGLVYFAETKNKSIKLNKKEHGGFEWTDMKEIRRKKFAFRNAEEWIKTAARRRNLVD